MAYFIVKYIGQEGNTLKKSVDGSTRDEAISKSGVPKSIILSVTLDHLGGLRSALLETRLPKNEQILALVTLASKMQAGKTVGKAIIEAIDYKKVQVTKEQLESCEIPSDYLKLLKFDETAILLTEAGDRSGKLAESFKKAADIIRSREKTRKEFAKPLRLALINIIAGISAGIGFPIFGGGMLESFEREQNLKITKTSFTHILEALNYFYTNQWFIAVAIIAVIFIFRKPIWTVIRSWPFFQLFDNRLRVQRGLDFIQSYQLLTSSGYTNPMVFKFMMERSSGRQRLMYEVGLNELSSQSRELGDIFQNPEWPKIISQNLQGFEQLAPDGRDQVLTNLNEALTEMFVQYSDKIARIASIASVAVIISSIMIFALGFYVPLMSMNTR
tara:strand:+ start:7205 stop:8365 length:1161 start_codon:yes stop_codon:yes gene_type:complete